MFGDRIGDNFEKENKVSFKKTRGSAECFIGFLFTKIGFRRE